MAKNLENAAVCDLVNEVFDEVEKAKEVTDLEKVIENNEYLKLNKMSEITYPPIQYTLKVKEVEKLEYDGYLDNDGRFVGDLSGKGEEITPLVKLLYAIVWKNGDLGKERHIVSGVKSVRDNNKSDYPDDGLVFYGFGRYLANRDNPIIDQHVIRAFLLKSTRQNNNENEVKKIRKISVINKKYKDVIKSYEEWLNSDELQADLKEVNGYKFHIDKVLFALGRAVKSK